MCRILISLQFVSCFIFLTTKWFSSSISSPNSFVFPIVHKNIRLVSTMADPIQQRILFERYVYDYMKRKNMHNTAEVFRKEANLKFDPKALPAIDVSPDGFLHEWWSVFYDTFSACQRKNNGQNEGPSTMTEQQSDDFLSRDYEMEKQTFGCPAFNFGLASEGNLLPSMGLPVRETEQFPQGFSLSEHQHEPLASAPGILYSPGNIGNLIGEVGPSVYAALRTGNISVNEESRKGMNPSDSEDGNVADNNTKPSSSCANNSKDRGGAFFSNLLTCSMSPQADIQNGLASGGNLLPSVGLPVGETEQFLQGFSLSEHQHEPLASAPGILYSPDDIGNLIGEEFWPPIYAASRTGNISANEGANLMPPWAGNEVLNSFCMTDVSENELRDKPPSEESRKGMNPSDFEDGNVADNNTKPSSYANNSKNRGGAFISEADIQNGYKFWRHLVKCKFQNLCMLLSFSCNPFGNLMRPTSNSYSHHVGDRSGSFIIWLLSGLC